MNLNILWFVLIAVLYTGFFVLEGFDFGVGILLPFIGKSDIQKRVILNSIGPVWDANEVWLVLAGGATFAAFPQWYATLFSGFYLPLLIILLALIVRGVAFEFRNKVENSKWRSLWDSCTFVGSLIPPLLFGVAFANMLRGVPIDGNMNYTGGFFNLLNWYALLGGLAFLALSIMLGALFLSMKTDGEVLERSKIFTRKLWLPVLAILVLFLAATIFTKMSIAGIIFAVIAILAGITAYFTFVAKRPGLSFGMLVLASAANSATIFGTMYPNLMISSTNPDWSLTIMNAASSANTLTVMLIVVAIFLPVVLAYQAWNYWIFRKRITSRPEELHY